MDHFSSVFTSAELPDLELLESRDLLISHKISEAEIAYAHSQLDDNIKSGPDGIPPYFIKRFRASLISPLTILSNNSLPLGLFPSLWKKSFVFPIHKS